MTTALTDRPAPFPELARLGFDHGWLLLPPTFLKLGLPVLVVDHAHVGDPTAFGMEPFGTRDPAVPLPLTALRISSYDSDVYLRDSRTGDVVASTRLSNRHRARPIMLRMFRSAALIVGSTYELESTWAVLWSMAIGRTPILRAPMRRFAP